MPKPQVTILWDASMGPDYEDTIAALGSYLPPPEIKTSVAIQGFITPEAVRRLVRVAEDCGASIAVKVVAQWESSSDEFQLRLWPPPGPDVVTDNPDDEPTDNPQAYEMSALSEGQGLAMVGAVVQNS